MAEEGTVCVAVGVLVGITVTVTVWLGLAVEVFDGVKVGV